MSSARLYSTQKQWVENKYHIVLVNKSNACLRSDFQARPEGILHRSTVRVGGRVRLMTPVLTSLALAEQSGRVR